MADSVLIAHVDTEKITREQLALMPTPAGTDTHKVIPHIEVVNAIVETLGFRHIAVHKDEFAVSKDGNKCSASWNWTKPSPVAALPSGSATVMTRPCASL